MWNDVLSEAIRHGWRLQTLSVLILLALVYKWLARANPAVFFRSLFRFRKYSLERMKSLDYLAQDERVCIDQELRMINNLALTGLSTPGLQKAAVKFASYCGVRGKYLKNWRRYLTEKEGEILFDRVFYERNRKIWIRIIVPACLMLLIINVWLLTLLYGKQNFMGILLLNLDCWIVPLYLTSPAPIKLTNEMETYLRDFNAHPDSDASAVSAKY
ncbi:hypothetical protein [Pantoea sp. AMG 501]|uniref:hypothetical protein n=1 Tax=Pantoea sp. AMG 501 TaxID=2008894 RepID=UPI000B5AA9ED|nr:hypothetical protein [Pantoea sp. AMG 501]OWY74496.1 hypothetical protein CDN97_23195 [Pantoea sp. AMG 501]